MLLGNCGGEMRGLTILRVERRRGVWSAVGDGGYTGALGETIWELLGGGVLG